MQRLSAIRTSITLALLLITVSGCKRVGEVSTAEGARRTETQTQTRQQTQSRAQAPSNKGDLEGPRAAGLWNSDSIQELGRIIQRYLGTPYSSGGRYAEGIDCSRFTAEVFEEFDGRRLPRVARDQATVGESVGRNSMQYGDLVFFDIGGSVSHVGIYLGRGNFVHASSSRGVVIDDIRTKYWSNNFHSARRVILPRASKS